MHIAAEHERELAALIMEHRSATKESVEHHETTVRRGMESHAHELATVKAEKQVGVALKASLEEAFASYKVRPPLPLRTPASTSRPISLLASCYPR